MIGTIEALGVFLLAILPGFVGLRIFQYARPPLRIRGTLDEIGATTLVSFIAWTGLYLWRGDDLLPVVLDGDGPAVAQRLDAFAELVALSIVIGCALGILGRLAVTAAGRAARASVAADDTSESTWASRRRRLINALQKRILPASAWDRLLARLVNHGEAVVCRVTRTDGTEVFGTIAKEGYLDWDADGRDLLLKPELVRNGKGTLEPVAGSLGIFVPGDHVASLSVVSYPTRPLD
jgi:hypothetical protein